VVAEWKRQINHLGAARLTRFPSPARTFWREVWSSMPTGTDRLIKRAGIEGCHDPINRLKMKNISD
jgi:hypothetical protein